MNIRCCCCYYSIRDIFKSYINIGALSLIAGCLNGARSRSDGDDILLLPIFENGLIKIFRLIFAGYFMFVLYLDKICTFTVLSGRMNEEIDVREKSNLTTQYFLFLSLSWSFFLFCTKSLHKYTSINLYIYMEKSSFDTAMVVFPFRFGVAQKEFLFDRKYFKNLKIY